MNNVYKHPSKHKTYIYHLYNVGLVSKTLGRRCTNNIQMFCVYWTRDNNIIVNHVAKYKETASKSSRKYEKIRGEALADQEMGPGWFRVLLILV